MPKYAESELKKMFSDADFSKDGALFHNELALFLKKLGINATAADVMEGFDKDGDGSLQFAEFKQAMDKFFP